MVLLHILSLCVFADEIDNVAMVLKNGETAEKVINIAENGEYEFLISFKVLDDSTERIEYSVKIDGVTPFSEAELLEAPVIYEDDGDIITLSNGDQTAPAGKIKDGYITSVAYDKTGVRLSPYTFELSSGEHIVTIENKGNEFELESISFAKPESVVSYEEVSKNYSQHKKYTGEQIVVEAEKPAYKNDYSLSAKSDTGSADITPTSAINSLIK